MNPRDLVLKSVADNKSIFDALKEKILEKFEHSEIKLDGVDNNLLGQIYRARLEGSRLVEEAFRDIARLKTSETKQRVNIAR